MMDVMDGRQRLGGLRPVSGGFEAFAEIGGSDVYVAKALTMKEGSALIRAALEKGALKSEAPTPRAADARRRQA